MSARPPAKKRSLYDILGVPRDAMAIDIGVAYKRRLAELDKRPDADPNEISLVREAYHILCQPREREAYDASLLTREEREQAKTMPAPDIVLEAEDPADKPRRIPWGWIVVAVIAVGSLLVFGLRTPTPPPPEPVAAPEPPKSAPPPPPRERSAQEAFTAASPAVARIVGYEVSGKAVPVGSGIVVADDAIVTTCHRLPAGGQIVARVGQEQLPATLVLTDEAQNLCRLSVPRTEMPVLASTPGDDPKAGDKVFAIAQHQGGDLSVVETTIKSVSGGAWQLGNAVSASASGGALVDRFGRFVGILTNRPSGALPASALAQMRTRGKAEPSKSP